MIFLHDMEAFPLQIETDSVELTDKVMVSLYAEGDDVSFGAIILTLSNPPEYSITYCTLSTPFLVTLPAEQTKMWTFTKTVSALKVECNGEEVLAYLFSKSTDGECVTRYSNAKVHQIMFSDSDSASVATNVQQSGIILLYLLHK